MAVAGSPGASPTWVPSISTGSSSFPVVLGKGKGLFFEGAAPTGFELAEVVTTSTGVMVTTFRPTGPPQAGGIRVVDGAEVIH